MCFSVDGACRVWGPDGFVECPQGSLLVIPPEAMHGEGWCERETPYRLLWLAVARDAAEVFTDTYQPGEGWTLGGRVFSPDAGGELVRQALEQMDTEAGSDATAARFLLKGGLLTILARLLSLANDTETGQGEREHGSDLAEAVRRHLDLNYADSLSVSAVAARFGRSANHLNRIFSKRHGKGIHAYLSQRRLEVANRLLKQHDMMVKEAAYRVGFTDPLHFCRLYKQQFGFAPSETRL
jgi:AraC-like DNA-binding protein